MSVTGPVEDDVFEPLAETAHFARVQSATSCDPAVGCRPYHAAWQYLRLLGVNKTIRGDRPFFIGRFRDAARRGHRRVLVSGAADYGMLAQLLHAYRAEGVEPEIVFADRCATSVAVNLDYARRVDATIDTVTGHIFDLDCPPVDLVCTHSFLTFFAPEERWRLLETWRRLLRPGGQVVTSTPIWKSGTHPAGFGSPEMGERFAAQVRVAALATPEYAGLAEELAADAAKMAGGLLRHPLCTFAEVQGLLTDGGFAVDVLEPSRHDASDRSPFTPPGSVRLRLEIAATRLD